MLVVVKKDQDSRYGYANRGFCVLVISQIRLNPYNPVLPIKLCIRGANVARFEETNAKRRSERNP